MLRKPLVIAVMTLAASLGSSLIGGAPAAADPQASKADIEYVRTALAKYDVPTKTQDAHLRSLSTGSVGTREVAQPRFQP